MAACHYDASRLLLSHFSPHMDSHSPALWPFYVLQMYRSWQTDHSDLLVIRPHRQHQTSTDTASVDVMEQLGSGNWALIAPHLPGCVPLCPELQALMRRCTLWAQDDGPGRGEGESGHTTRPGDTIWLPLQSFHSVHCCSSHCT